MSNISITGNASGTGIFTIQSPNSNVNRVLTLPDNTGTILTSATTTGFPAGSVLQVVSTNSNTSYSTTSSSLSDATNLSVSITPSSSSNKILLICSVVATNSNGNGNFYFKRNATSISVSEKYFAATGTTTQVSVSMSYLDSPATTSAITYLVQFNAGGGTQHINQNGAYSTITAMEIAA
jgi:hypothetical protein